MDYFPVPGDWLLEKFCPLFYGNIVILGQLPMHRRMSAQDRF